MKAICASVNLDLFMVLPRLQVIPFSFTRWGGVIPDPTSEAQAKQNPYVERLIETLRRDCLDHVLIFGEWHLQRVLKSYSVYYDEPTWDWVRMRHYNEPSNDRVRSAPGLSGADCLIALHGYSFREGQVLLSGEPGIGKSRLTAALSGARCRRAAHAIALLLLAATHG